MCTISGNHNWHTCQNLRRNLIFQKNENCVCECISGHIFSAEYFDVFEIKINSELVKECIIIVKDCKEIGYLTSYIWKTLYVCIDILSLANFVKQSHVFLLNSKRNAQLLGY